MVGKIKCQITIFIIKVFFWLYQTVLNLKFRTKVNKKPLKSNEILPLTVRRFYRSIFGSRVFYGLRNFFHFGYDTKNAFASDYVVSALRLTYYLSSLGYRTKILSDFVIFSEVTTYDLISICASVQVKYVVDVSTTKKKAFEYVTIIPMNFTPKFNSKSIVREVVV